jgi:hypothetical protein
MLSTRRDGVEPEEACRWLKSCQRLLPPFLGLVSMPTSWLGARQNADDTAIYRKRTTRDAEQARFVSRALLNRLCRTLVRLEVPIGRLRKPSGTPSHGVCSGSGGV